MAKKNSGGKTLAGLAESKKQQVKPIEKFHNSLALSRWALKIIKGHSLDLLRATLNRREMEGIDAETGHTLFFNAVIGSSLFELGDPTKVTKSALEAYDLRVVGYWQQITASAARRDADGNPVKMKYYQWLTLMVTELYLDCYFNRRAQLLNELNAEIDEVNKALPAKEHLAAAKLEDLDKVSFWEATGSGKTLLMHVNILQYKWYAAQVGKSLDRVILLTPNEGLANQHLEELKASGIPAASLTDDLFKNDTSKVGVVDSNKLSSKGAGVKVMAAESFEGKNLVMVDEGHHGSSKEDGEHRKVRDMLAKDGFSFEYSATFGQAVSSENKKDVRVLWDLYARNILFDYSYRYFFDDGYGKEAMILNLDERTEDPEARRFEYLVGNLLAYYQQHYVYEDKDEQPTMKAFGIARPLCLFVGNTVLAPKKDKKTGEYKLDETSSDVWSVIKFLASVLNRRSEVENLIKRYRQNDAVIEVGDKNPFYNMFLPISKGSEKEVYDDMLRKVFKASGVQKLHLQLLKKTGEIILRVGNGPVFGVINIGDSAGFLSAAMVGTEFIIDPADDMEDTSYFATLNDKDSPVTILVGSRKFTEGWSSWRVSAMGLLNMGVSEGTQIIQLFGRGVRLQGKNFSLKRSKESERPSKSHLRKLETLNVFGIRANYMAKFKEYLELEIGRPLDSVLTLDFPVKHRSIPAGLKVPQVADGYGLNQVNGFKAKKTIVLFKIPDEDKKRIKKPVFIYEDYSSVQALMVSDKNPEEQGTGEKKSVKIDGRAMPFIDMDRVYLRLLEEKACKHFENLEINRGELQHIADEMFKGKDGAHDWYQLYSREADVTFDSFSKLENIERLFTKLVVGYMEVFYKTLQHLYEDEHMEIVPVTEKMLNEGDFRWPQEYQFEFEDNEDGNFWKGRLENLKGYFEDADFPAKCSMWSSEGTRDFVAIAFRQSLYVPLFYSRKGAKLPLKMKPLSFDAPSEMRFVEDLERYYESPANHGFFANIDLYLMRNASNKARGLGFAQAGNFYPDFLLWLKDKSTGKEYLSFIDPKGLRNVSFESPKLNFAKEVKELEKVVNKDQANKLILNSIILSDTPYSELADLFSEHSKDDYEAKHVFFLDEGSSGGTDGGKYLPKMFEAMKMELPDA